MIRFFVKKQQRLLLVVALCTLCCAGAQGQMKATWQLLSDVKYQTRLDPALGISVMIPTFGPGPRSLHGKEVVVTGYFLPMNRETGFFLLSKYPYASCFFCGAAGAETIVELQFRQGASIPYRMDQLVTLKGRLRLNATDFAHSSYILENVE